jgi:hypothetical protein
MIVPTLLSLFVILLISFSVLMAAYAIAAALGDAGGARALGWTAAGCLILLTVDALLLLCVLALLQIDPQWGIGTSRHADARTDRDWIREPNE